MIDLKSRARRMAHRCQAQSVGSFIGPRQPACDALAYLAADRARSVRAGWLRDARARQARLTLQCTRDQSGIRLKLEGEDAAGHWKTLSDTPQESVIAPIPDLRRMAGEELKTRGVDYLLVFGSDFGADDFRLRQQEWGIVQVGELGADRLYKVTLNSQRSEYVRQDRSGGLSY